MPHTSKNFDRTNLSEPCSRASVLLAGVPQIPDCAHLLFGLGCDEPEPTLCAEIDRQIEAACAEIQRRLVEGKRAHRQGNRVRHFESPRRSMRPTGSLSDRADLAEEAA